MTARELRTLWEERDDRYSHRRSDLSATAVEGIRIWRMREVDSIPPDDRGSLFSEVSRWEPPAMRR
jgi:hypothetical protein